MSDKELLEPAGNEENKSALSKLGAIASKVTSAAKGVVNSTKSGLHNASVFTSRISATQIKDKIKVYVKEGIHNSVQDGLAAREYYLQKVQDDINSKEDDDSAIFEQYISKTAMGGYTIKWPLPNRENVKEFDNPNNKITTLEHLGKFTTSLSVDNDSREDVRKVYAVNALKKLIGDLQQELAQQESAADDDAVVKEGKEATAKEEADNAIKQSKINTVIMSGEKQRLTTLLQKRNYLPGVFLTFDRENTPTLYYYDYSENSSEYETKILDPLFPTEKQGDSIKRVNITKDNTDAIWAILLANQIGEGEDKKDVPTQFDPGFNTTKPTFKEVKFNTAQPATGGDGDAPEAAPAGIENLEKYKATFHSIEKYLKPNHPVEGMTDAERDTMWNIACYASQVGWLDWLEHVNPKPNLFDLLLSEEEMKKAWNNCDWNPNNEKVDNSLKNKWSGYFDTITFCGYLGSVDSGEIPGSNHVFILQNGLIKVLNDGNSEYKIKTISEPENLKLTFEKKGSMGGKRRRKSHRKSHKKTQKKHKKQMKKSHKKKTRGKKTRGKKC
jgi:hypothetical protein